MRNFVALPARLSVNLSFGPPPVEMQISAVGCASGANNYGAAGNGWGKGQTQYLRLPTGVKLSLSVAVQDWINL